MAKCIPNFLIRVVHLFIIFTLSITVNDSLAASPQKAKVKAASKSSSKRAKNDMLAAADIERGKALSVGCTACHTFKKGVKSLSEQKNVTQRVFMGPNLFGIFGKKMAIGDYPYSAALKKLGKRGKTWTVDELYKWLRSPSIYAPGTYMVFGGMGDPQDRLDLIAYISTLK
ncbi:MAG: c-type cytochrome [Bdellovibrionales bacterium]|jgi:cytochrome c|nr:c-type cytochrome [Bdellovibrionales bacterium]MBT3527012.1 c-type cytochrome [Bdellovibrionales bacterium]MBT7669517.1 c-type cytochrome [Bdellovibrionales bacterium]MBT7765779.1 c-type cytochrome [Bdellovibrionales bacterium]